MNRVTALGGTLTLFGAICAWFYVRQNAGVQVGGEISAPKMLWLGYAVAAWFIIPAFLWSDPKVSAQVRKGLRFFWVVMMVRGVIELILIYGFGHWHPWYGIGHDLLAFAIVLWWRLKAAPDGDRDRWTLRYGDTLLLGLLAETVFAWIFLQSGVFRDGVYFASTHPTWTLVNYLTTVVVAVVYADLALVLGSYFSQRSATVPRWRRSLRPLALGLCGFLVLAGGGLWTWMTGVETEARRFQKNGYEVADTCVELRDTFMARDWEAVSAKIAAGTADWSRTVSDTGHDFRLERWGSGGPERPFLDELRSWRNEFADLAQAAIKVHLLDEVGDDFVTAQVRFELTGQAQDGSRRTDSGIFRCRFESSASGGESAQTWRVASVALVHGTTASGPGTAFPDRAVARGIDFHMENDARFVPCSTCTEHDCSGPPELRFQTMRHAYAGCATADVDGDGADDMFFCAGGRARFYRNRGDGTFVDATESSGIGTLWHVNAAVFGDLDNDGDPDLVLARFYGRNQILENDGTGRFRCIEAKAPWTQIDHVTCLSLLDYDNDGDLDVYWGRFLAAEREIPGSFLYARNGEPNSLLRNDGELRFEDVTEAAGVGDIGLALSLAAADYDRDGDQDLYVANDFGRNVLYQNQGDGTFQDVAREVGALAVGGSMSASWGDVDNDGRLDLYVAAIRSNQRWFVQPITARRVVLKFLREGKLNRDNPLLSDLKDYLGDDWLNIGNHALAGNSLLRQREDGTFVDEAEIARARPAGWYWSAGFFDLDQDGDQDIIATDGWITGKDPHDL